MNNINRLAARVKDIIAYDKQIKQMKDGRAVHGWMLEGMRVEVNGRKYVAIPATDTRLKEGMGVWVQITKYSDSTAIVLGAG